jgi:hypothetical protein
LITRAARTLRFLSVAAIAVFAVFCVLLLVIRLVVFPRIDEYRERIVATLSTELGQPVATIPATSNDFRYSYGGGTRIALGEALVARIDVGFSDEETGLVYLTFGDPF